MTGINKRIALLSLILFTLIAQTFAQNGKIVGTVTDAVTGDPLPGANILVMEEGNILLGVATNMKGEFNMLKVPVGDHQLRVNYIGYQQITKEITVEEKETSVIDVEMAPSALEGEEVVVTAQARGQMEAINQQISSRTISNIVSSEKIQELPDANAAESVGRLPGISLVRNSGEGDKVVIRGLEPKLNLITVNGVRAPSTDENNNSVGLAGISSYMLAGIEVRKALLPDQDADAVGGTVDLKLNEAPEGLHGNLVLEGGYNGLTNSIKTYKVVGQASNRFFHNLIGLYGQINIEQADRANERLNAGYAREGELPDGTVPIRLENSNFGYNEIYRNRMGASLLGDLRLPSGKIKFSTIYNNFSEDNFSRDKVISMATTPFHRHGHNSRITDNESLISTIDYEQTIINTTLNLGGSYTSGYRTDAKNYSLTQDWGAPPGENIIDLAAPRVNAGPYAWPPYLNETVDYTYILNINSFTPELDEKNRAVYANWKLPFYFGKWFNGFLKVGGKYREKEREYTERNRGATLIHGGWFPLTTFIEEINPEIDFGNRVYGQHLSTVPLFDEDFSREVLDGQVTLENFVQRKWVDQILSRMDKENWMDHSKINNEIYQVDRDYTGEEYLSAGYAMSEVNIGKKIIFIPGFRYEKEVTKYSSFGVKDLGQGMRSAQPLSSKRTNDFLLPMVHLRYKIFDWADLRMAYTQSLARPEYYHFMPRYFYNLEGDLTDMGNVNLEPAVSTNYDVNVSLYENKLGLLTIGGFYKEIDGFEHFKEIKIIDKEEDNAIHNYKYLANVTQSIFTFINNEKPAYVRGLEFDWQTNFWYLPKPLNGLVLNLNYTRIASETQYSTVKLETITPNPATPWVKEYVKIEDYDERNLIRQPKEIMNIQVGYDIGGLSTRLAYYFQGKTLTGKGNIEETDRYSVDYSRWDFTMKYKLPVDGLSLYFSANNITNVPDQSYQFKKKFLTMEEYYGMTSSLGLRFKF